MMCSWGGELLLVAVCRGREWRQGDQLGTSNRNAKSKLRQRQQEKQGWAAVRGKGAESLGLGLNGQEEERSER